MKKLMSLFDFKSILKKEKILLVLGVFFVFCFMAFSFLSNKIGEKRIEYTSPYVDDCAYTMELVDGIVVEQSFSSSLDVIEGIYIETGTYARNNTSDINIIITNKDGENIFDEDFTVQDAVDNQFSYFGFSTPLSIENEDGLMMHIESKGNDGGNGIALVKSNYDSYTSGELWLSGEKQIGDCLFYVAGYNYNSTVFNPLYVVSVVFLGAYLVLVSIFIICKKEYTKEGDASYVNVKINFIKILKICIVFVAVLCISSADYKVINNVFGRTQLEYMVHISGPETLRVDDTGIEINFLNHAKNLISDNIMFEKSDAYLGYVTYTVMDSKGNILIEDTKNLSSVMTSYNGDWDELVINCDDADLEQNEKYDVILNFQETEPLYIVTNSSGEIQQRQIMHNSYRNIYKLVMFVVSAFMLLIIAYAVVVGFSANVFLVTALITGSIACIIQTPCAADDEYRHFLRAYDVANWEVEAEYSENWIGAKGNIIADSNNKADIIAVPEQINELRLLDMRSNYDNMSYEAEMNYQGCIDEAIRTINQDYTNDKVYVSIVATAGINAIVYSPQIVFIFIAKLLGMSALGVFYMARLGNMLFSAVVMYIIVRKIPEYKNIFYALYFAPNAFWIRSSCNRDAFVTTIVIMLIAYILYIKINKLNILTFKRIVLLIALTVIIGISKLPYICVSAILLVLNKDSFRNMSGNRTFLCKVGLIIFAMVCGVSGYKISTYHGNSDDTVDTAEIVTEETYHQESHLEYALNNPQKVLSVMWGRYSAISEDIYRAIQGYRFKFGKMYMYMLLLICVLTNRRQKVLEKIWELLVFAGVWFLIIIVGYTYMAPDYGSIWGVNPRYMIPILPLLALFFVWGNKRTEKYVNLVAPVATLSLTAMDMITMITVYW